MLTPETIRAYQRRRVYLMIARSLYGLSGAPRSWTNQDDPFALPTAYGDRERDYYNRLDDEIAQ